MYEDLGGGRLRCKTHDVIVVQPRRCPQCAPLPVVVVADEIDAIADPPEGCKTTLEHEREFTTLAKDLEYAARKLIADGSNGTTEGKAIDPKALKGLADTAIKARRAAAELAHGRERKHRVNEREKRMRDRAKGNGN